MKFQNPSFKFFFEQTDGQNKRTNGRTSRKQYAPHFFKVVLLWHSLSLPYNYFGGHNNHRKETSHNTLALVCAWEKEIISITTK